jgi:hypothetical protein
LYFQYSNGNLLIKGGGCMDMMGSILLYLAVAVAVGILIIRRGGGG